MRHTFHSTDGSAANLICPTILMSAQVSNISGAPNLTAMKSNNRDTFIFSSPNTFVMFIFTYLQSQHDVNTAAIVQNKQEVVCFYQRATFRCLNRHLFKQFLVGVSH